MNNVIKKLKFIGYMSNCTHLWDLCYKNFYEISIHSAVSSIYNGGFFLSYYLDIRECKTGFDMDHIYSNIVEMIYDELYYKNDF